MGKVTGDLDNDDSHRLIISILRRHVPWRRYVTQGRLFHSKNLMSSFPVYSLCLLLEDQDVNPQPS